MENYKITQTHKTGQKKFENEKLNTEGNKVTNFDPLYLLERYFPLRKSVYNKYYSRFQLPDQREELSAQIDFEFLQLVNDYDMSRGVDFPYYIGLMLNFRIKHYIEKNDNIKINEVFLEDTGAIENEQNNNTYEADKIIDAESEKLLEIVDALNSVDSEIMEDSVNAVLIRGVLSEGKSIEEIAGDLKIPFKKLNKRFNELCEELRKRAVNANQKFEEKDGLSEEIVIKRKPIIIK